MTVIVLLVIAVAIVLGMAAQKPDIFHVERSIDIRAGAEKIFPHINSMAAWKAWSPYEKLDPNAKKTLSGLESGVGSSYAWDGNSKGGKGSCTVTESVPPLKVVMRLVMEKPFKAENSVTFTLNAQGASTHVVWAMDGKQPLMAKVMSMFMNCDKMCGDQFNEGLASLKALVES